MYMKLNQIIAIEKGIKTRVTSGITTMHHASQKAGLFNGFAKNYRPLDEEGEKYSPESQKVQMLATEILTGAATLWGDILDVTFAKDSANCKAFANVTIDGQVILKDAPVPFLLFLEKTINDIRTFVDKLPTLDQAEDWQRDENSGLFKTP